MRYEDFIEKIKSFEGFRSHAYLCPAGKWTIGFGRTGPGVGPGSITTREIEDNWIHNYINKLYKEIENLLIDYGYNFEDYQIQALTSFAYNCGIGNKDRGLICLLKSGKRSASEISAKIPEYNKGGGVVLPGLVARRKWERNLFDGKLEKPDGINNPTAKDLQILLNQVGGYNLEVDGKIGRLTRAAAYDYIVEASHERNS